MGAEGAVTQANSALAATSSTPEVAAVTQAGRWRNLIILLTSSRRGLDAIAADSFLKQSWGGEEDKAPSFAEFWSFTLLVIPAQTA